MLRDYIEIEKIRLSHKDAINLIVEQDYYNGNIAPAMLISFVENAVKHGLDSRMEDAFVMIRVRVDESAQVLHFYCCNNYLSRPVNAAATYMSKAGGIGLENVRKRLELIYPGNHSLKITNENNIFEVALTVKLNR